MRDPQGGAYDIAQVVEVQGLGDEIERPGLERGDGGFHVAEGGDDRDRQIGVFVLDEADEVYAVAVRQAHVGQAQVEFVLVQQIPGLLEIRGRARLEVHASQRQLQDLADVGLVVYDEDLVFALVHNDPSSAHSSGRAKVTRKRLPTPPSPGW